MEYFAVVIFNSKGHPIEIHGNHESYNDAYDFLKYCLVDMYNHEVPYKIIKYKIVGTILEDL